MSIVAVGVDSKNSTRQPHDSVAPNLQSGLHRGAHDLVREEVKGGLSVCILHVNSEEEEEANSNPRNQLCQDPSIPSQKGICHFLQLPQELRDEIYAYALTEDHGLISIPTQRSFIFARYNDQSHKLFRSSDDQEANVLKYVCRQMYYDTAGLGLKYNQVIFHSRPGAPAFQQLRWFFNKLSPKNRNRIRATLCASPISDKDKTRMRADRIIENFFPEDWVSEVHDMTAFCQEHPRISLAYRLNVPKRSLHSMAMGAALFEAFRGMTLPLEPLMYSTVGATIEEIADHLRQGREAQFINAPNFRFFFLQGKVEGFWTRIGDTFKRRGISYTDGDLDFLDDMMEVWTRKGI